MSKDDKPEEDSDISPVAIPQGGFQSRLPAYLLDGKSESEKYLLTEMSRNSHFIEWAGPILVSSNYESRKTNGRLKRVEAWKAMIMNWKVLLVALGGLITFVASVIQFLPLVKAFFSAE